MKLLDIPTQYQLEPFQYPWAWDLSREREQDNWAPEEVPTSMDVSDFRSDRIPAPERQLFLGVMEQLTTMDMARSEESILCLILIFENEEIRQFLFRMAWEERLHTRSYRYIIETMGLGTDIYTQWEKVPEMKARIDYGARDVDALWELMRKKQLGRDLDQLDKQTLLKSLIFWFLIFEGVWFMINLKGPIQLLARRGFVKGAAEQLQYIARDETGHVQFGLALIQTFISEYPEAWDEVTKSEVRNMFVECMSLEEDFAHYCQSAGPVLGYSVPDHIETAKVFANVKLQSLGLDPIWPGVKHRFPWMSEQMEFLKEKNFFETRVTEYRAAGALNWDDDVVGHFASPMDR